MSEVLQTNIFFVITSVAVIILTVLVAIALFKIIRILGRLEDITERVRTGTEQLADDVSTARAYVKSGVANIISLIAGGIGKKRSPGRGAKRSGKAREKDTGEEQPSEHNG